MWTRGTRTAAAVAASACLSLAALVLAGSPAFPQGASDDYRIIVSGASGNLGGLTVEALLDMGVPASRLILVSRTPERLAKYSALGASTRFGDFTQPESLPEAYAGGTRMLLISIGGGELQEPRPVLHERAIDAAVAAGVEHIAYTSWAAISGGETTGISTDHLETERILRESGAAWTMLRNSVYMDGLVQQAAAMVADGRAVAPPDESRLGHVTRADCAAAAAVVLTTTGHESKVYDITGPRARRRARARGRRIGGDRRARRSGRWRHRCAVRVRDSGVELRDHARGGPDGQGADERARLARGQQRCALNPAGQKSVREPSLASSSRYGRHGARKAKPKMTAAFGPRSRRSRTYESLEGNFDGTVQADFGRLLSSVLVGLQVTPILKMRPDGLVMRRGIRARGPPAAQSSPARAGAGR